MNATLSRLTATAVRAAAAFAAALTLASCGGGGVSANPSPIVDSPTLTILPATAIMYSGMPTTFVFSGGTGAYIIASSDQAVLPAIGGVTGRSVTLVPNTVVAETTVTLTLRDTGSAAPVTATVTVRPGTVNNNITITPSSTQSADCSPAICSGGDAEVKVTISQGSIPLPARGVRFDVVSGSFDFIISAPGAAEQVATSHVVVTDETGAARTRLRVRSGAPNQTALLQVTDLGTGAFRQASFVIAQYNGNSPAFFTLPSAITLTGPNTTECSGGTAEVAIFGGTPPYTVVGASPSFSVFVNGVPAPPAFVATSGGKFSVSFGSTRACVENLPVGVTDAAGRTLTVSVTNKVGTAAPPITLSPTQIIDLRCGQSASLVIIGGTEPFSSSSSDGLLLVTPPAVRTVTMNAITSGAFPVYATRNATITVTDGATSASAPVTFRCP
ncbi:MAG: hypothetical protein FIB05_09715 [Betaproteobacteria bacterium]|nr:hypothetical protein [Betaproteobacteria bacterium]PWB64774.1 MAG: hypothetical protein C3F16_03450 [Betaproteobacteria bacterium]